MNFGIKIIVIMLVLAHNLIPAAPHHHRIVSSIGAGVAAYSSKKIFDAVLNGKKSGNPYATLSNAGSLVAAMIVAYKTYDYVQTIENHSYWPCAMVACLERYKQQCELLHALCASSNGTTNHVSLIHLQKLQDAYHQALDEKIVLCSQVQWDVCTEQDVQKIQEIQLASVQLLSPEIVLTRIAHDHPAIKIDAEKFYTGLGNARNFPQDSAAARTQMQKAAYVLGNYFEKQLQCLEQEWAGAFKHAQRLSTLYTARNIANAAHMYARWRLSEWWYGPQE